MKGKAIWVQEADAVVVHVATHGQRIDHIFATPLPFW